jgi:type IV pilus assembly protein PilY1
MNTPFLKLRRFATRAVIFFPVFLITPNVFAADTDLADVPMAVKNAVSPNIIFVTDDSGSMGNEVLMPTNDGALWWNADDRSFVGRDSNDDVAANVINFNKTGNNGDTWKNYIYLFPNSTGTGDRTYGDGANEHFAIPPTAAFAWLRSSDYNPLYYNPLITYQPWASYNDGTVTTSFSNATPTAAKSHPLLGSDTLDLTNNVNSNSSGWTFRMWPGMVAPSGASYKQDGAGGWTALGADTAVPDGHYWDVQISYYPATYYMKDPDGTFTGPDGTTKLKRYEIKDGNSFPSGRSYSDELQNFANWFTYYRKRILSVNAAMGSTLSGLGGLRGGIVRFNNLSAVTMYDFDQAADNLNQKRLLNTFYNIAPGGGTPTRDALDYAGQQFMRTNTGAPIQYSCQFNIGFVLTDGFAANSSSVTISPSNYDGQTNYGAYPYNHQYNTNGDIVTFPYQDTYEGTLSDIAMKYYTTNLRTDLPAGKVPVNISDTSPNADRNPNLHMNTYALGLGVKGFVFGTGSDAATNPFATAPTWPDPNAANRSPAGVDDLWHATLNGRGDMFTAKDTSAVHTGLDTVVNAVIGKAGSAAAVTVSNPNVVVGGVNASYNSNYNSGNWTGDLNAYPISTSDGSVDITHPIWASSAQAQLDTKTSSTYSSTTRAIVTYSGTGSATDNGTGGIQFQPSDTPTSADIVTTLTSAQEAAFNSPTTPPGPSDAAAVIKYLRGDRSAEGTTYRSRAHVLGDIINAEPLIVQAPSRNYTDACYSSMVQGTCAQSFKDAKASRTSVLFQAANDGMVHAFIAGSGAESWAYVPKLIWPTLVNRTKKSGFTHQYYIDATPVSGDVDLRNTDGGSTYFSVPAWRTLLVGGLGKGGRGYYALDVTTPDAASEADAAAKVLWEFPNSSTSATDAANMGYSYARPILVKTLAKGWVVIVPSGYNNTTGGGTGHGYLYVLNPRNGAVIKVIDTGVGTTSAPAGLAKLSPYIDNADLDGTVSYVYGGDLLGNVWRFDFTAGSTSYWGVTKLATLTDGASPANPQPVTTEPELADITISGTDYHFVYVGTGQYLGDTDIATTGTQTMYGLIDDLSNSPLISRADLQAQTMTVDPNDSSRRNVTSNAVAYSGGSAKKGWYLDLSLSSGERIVTDPQLALGILAFTSNIPSSTQCVPGGSSWFYTIDYQTGGLVANSVTYSGVSLGNALASRPTLIKLPSGAVKAIIRLSDVTTQVKDLPSPPSATSGRRVAWKEVITN